MDNLEWSRKREMRRTWSNVKTAADSARPAMQDGIGSGDVHHQAIALGYFLCPAMTQHWRYWSATAAGQCWSRPVELQTSCVTIASVRVVTEGRTVIAGSDCVARRPLSTTPQCPRLSSGPLGRNRTPYNWTRCDRATTTVIYKWNDRPCAWHKTNASYVLDALLAL